MCDIKPDDDGRNLSSIFNEIWKFYIIFENGCDRTTNEHKAEMSRTIEDTEKAVHMVNFLGIFSTNEEISEVATNEIRYILLPALLGYFTENKAYDENRLEYIDKSQIYYKDFIRLCNNYGISDVKAPPSDKLTSGTVSMAALNKHSEDRVTLYRAEIARNKILSAHEAMGLEKIDEEQLREYHSLTLEKFIAIAVKSLESFILEKEILVHQKKLREDKVYASETLLQNLSIKKKESKHPFIITKNKLQKEVFGAGYPSTPVMTMDEYYDEMVRTGEVPPPSSAPPLKKREGEGTVRRIEGGDASATAPDSEETKARKDEEIDTDNVEALAKARDWDAFKDDNRRGWGNRQNMG